MFTRVLLTNSFIHSGVVGVCGTCVGVDFPSEVGREGCKRGKEGAGERSGAVGFECAGPSPFLRRAGIRLSRVPRDLAGLWVAVFRDF